MSFFKLIEIHLLLSEFYIYQNARCNNKYYICLNCEQLEV